MKTLNKTITLLFAAAAFTACTKPAIEPIRPVTVAGLPVDQSAIDDALPAKNRHKIVTMNEEVHLNGQQPVVTPTQPTPRPTTQPATKHPKPILTDASDTDDADAPAY